METVVVRGPLRGVVRATVLEHEGANLSMWVTACELGGFKPREVRHRICVPCLMKSTLEPVPGTLIDVSHHGACVESHGEVDPGDLLTVEFTLGKELVRGSFWVVWSERGVGRPVTRYGLKLNEEIRLAASDWKAAVSRIARKAA